MAYQTLIAHCQQADDLEAVLDVATSLAARHGAHLVGLHVVPRLDVQFAYEVPAVVAREFESERRAYAETLGERFEAATAGGDFVAEWRVVDGTMTGTEQALTELGNTADLLVAGLSPDARRRGSRSELTARLLGASGRPLVLVPPERRAGAVGERVFVAWDAERAATRALYAALPMLVRAEAVRLQRLNAPGQDRHRMLGSTEELADTLSRHGVAVEVFHADARAGEIGGDLLGFAEDWGADVLVSGCQEQGALREWLFGSTTRHLLEHAAIPLLMSS